MSEAVWQEIQRITAGQSGKEQLAFASVPAFYEYLQKKGAKASLAEVEAALSEKAGESKQELFEDDLGAVAGGAQVETVNIVRNNSKSVKIGSTIVISM